MATPLRLEVGIGTVVVHRDRLVVVEQRFGTDRVRIRDLATGERLNAAIGALRSRPTLSAADLGRREEMLRTTAERPWQVGTAREIQSAVDGALRGADPPEDLWGLIEANEFLHVVRDVTSWAITNFESFLAHPPAYVVPPCLYLGAFEPFRWPDRRLAPRDARIGANRLDRVFDPSMRRAALWTARSLLATRHPRPLHESRALSLNERRQRAFRHQNVEGLAWLVARARH